MSVCFVAKTELNIRIKLKWSLSVKVSDIHLNYKSKTRIVIKYSIS
jgi:hypothetical protein